MKKRLITRNTPLAAVALLASIGALPWVSAAEEGIRVVFGDDDVLFQPRVGGEAVTVTVACAAGAYVEEEYAGTPPVLFELKDQDGLPVEDGPCGYEVRVHPVLDHAALAAAEEAGDQRLLEKLALQEQLETVVARGRFEVAAGSVVARPAEGLSR